MTCPGGNIENSSLDSLNGVCKVLVDISQCVSKFTTDKREHLSKNDELKSMVDLYFENISKTLNLLLKNKSTDEFATQYESVYNEQVILFAKIRDLQVVLEKKHKKAKRWRRIGYVTLGAALAPFAALSLLALSSPMVADAGQNVVERLKKLTDFMKVYEKSVKTQKDLSLLIEKCTKDNIGVMNKIKNL